MSIEIKKSEKPVIYEDAKKMMEERLINVDQNKSNELIWTLEHPDIYTAGTSYSESDILDKSIKILETNRGGKITYHGPGQLICYFVIDLRDKKSLKKLKNGFDKDFYDLAKKSFKIMVQWILQYMAIQFFPEIISMFYSQPVFLIRKTGGGQFLCFVVRFAFCVKRHSMARAAGTIEAFIEPFIE